MTQEQIREGVRRIQLDINKKIAIRTSANLKFKKAEISVANALKTLHEFQSKCKHDFSNAKSNLLGSGICKDCGASDY